MIYSSPVTSLARSRLGLRESFWRNGCKTGPLQGSTLLDIVYKGPVFVGEPGVGDFMFCPERKLSHKGAHLRAYFVKGDRQKLSASDSR